MTKTADLELDEDTVCRLISYCGHDPRERQKVTRTVFDEYADEWTAEEFQRLVTAAIESIPPDRRPEARVVLGGEWGESQQLTISYPDMQTDKEVALGVDKALAYVREQQNNERREYARLKAKFG